VLQLFSFGEQDPFGSLFETPPQAALERALELLRELGALERNGLSATARAGAAAGAPAHRRLCWRARAGGARGAALPAR